MSDDDLRLLEEAAKKATPGERSSSLRSMTVEGRMHVVTAPPEFPVAFVPAWDRPRPGEEDGTEEAIANAVMARLLHPGTVLALISRLHKAEADLLLARSTAISEAMAVCHERIDGYRSAPPTDTLMNAIEECASLAVAIGELVGHQRETDVR